mgnify:CR=1 FL=1
MDPIVWKYLAYVGAGAIGALVKIILEKEALLLPKVDRKTGKLYLGFVSALIIGALAGAIVDQNPITAFLGGFAGPQIIEQIQRKKLDIQKSGIKKALNI